MITAQRRSATISRTSVHRQRSQPPVLAGSERELGHSEVTLWYRLTTRFRGNFSGVAPTLASLLTTTWKNSLDPTGSKLNSTPPKPGIDVTHNAPGALTGAEPRTQRWPLDNQKVQQQQQQVALTFDRKLGRNVRESRRSDSAERADGAVSLRHRLLIQAV